MASYTENLNLLKKDPVADGADTFNITTMLNDNWDKIDAAKGQIDSALSNKADVGAPQSYTLPLSTGWSAPGGARYQRTQDNMVVVTTGGIQIDSGASVSDGAQIATLPTGYRPRDYILVPAVIQDGGTRHAAAVQITISGAIIYNGPSNTTHPFRIFINSSYFVN